MAGVSEESCGVFRVTSWSLRSGLFEFVQKRPECLETDLSKSLEWPLEFLDESMSSLENAFSDSLQIVEWRLEFTGDLCSL